MKENKYRRQSNYRDRQKDKGLIFMQKWVTPQEKAAIDSMVNAMRAQAAQRKEAA